VNEPDLAALMNEVIKIPDGEDAGIIGDLFDRDFITDLWEASVYALKAEVETEIAERLAFAMIRMYASGYASGEEQALEDGSL
jgi:hypothetical protein|tara:strand:- start:89 stop:337 length:249 start_codon:yes stop_codon:yes gene_type:complete